MDSEQNDLNDDPSAASEGEALRPDPVPGAAEGPDAATTTSGEERPSAAEGPAAVTTTSGEERPRAVAEPATPPDSPGEDRPPKRKKKKRRGKRKSLGFGSSRGIETMFRTSYRVHQDLVGLADAKANIMISVNGLIISITLAAVSPRIGGLPMLVLPTSILLVGCLVALVYAVLAARPRVSSTPLTLDDIARNDANILFFGNFVNLSEEDFVEGMRDLMMTPEHLYINMVRDLYGLGQVLKKKFRLLRVSYTVFMFTLVIGVGLFVLVFVLDATIAGNLLDSPTTLPLIP